MNKVNWDMVKEITNIQIYKEKVLTMNLALEAHDVSSIEMDNLKSSMN